MLCCWYILNTLFMGFFLVFLFCWVLWLWVCFLFYVLLCTLEKDLSILRDRGYGTASELCVLCKAAEINPCLSLSVEPDKSVWEDFFIQWEENTNLHIMHCLLFIFLLPERQSVLAQTAKMNLWEINFGAVVLDKWCLIQSHFISSRFAFIFKPCDYRWNWEKVKAALIPVCVLL